VSLKEELSPRAVSEPHPVTIGCNAFAIKNPAVAQDGQIQRRATRFSYNSLATTIVF
jgi:hypothetical protein